MGWIRIISNIYLHKTPFVNIEKLILIKVGNYYN
jgi:hypothetical protein